MDSAHSIRTTDVRALTFMRPSSGCDEHSLVAVE